MNTKVEKPPRRSRPRAPGKTARQPALDDKAFADSILNSLPGIFYMFGADGRLLRWSRNFEITTGYTAEEIARMHAVDFFEDADRALADQRIAEVLSTGKSHLEACLVSKDGKRTPYYFTGVRIALGTGNGVIGTGFDIGERLRAERLLRDLSLAVNASGDIVFLTDSEGTILSINSQFTTTYGYEEEEVVGKVTPRVLKSGAQSAEFYAEFWSRILNGELVQGEVVNRAKDGRLICIEETVNPFRDDTGNIAGFLAIQRNIGARKEAEAAVRQLTADLERRVAERTAQLEVANRELESFCYSVSHDLRAPLRAIDGFSEALLKEHGGSLNVKGRHYLDRVRAATHRMGDLITDLLDLSRVTRHALVRDTVDLSQLVRGIAVELRGREPERNVEFVVEPDVTARCDRRLLRIALTNLIENAWKFTSPRPAARIEFGTLNHSGARCFFVRDNGVGFPMQYVDKLFGPFQRLHSGREFSGTGIGLATVERVVHRHAGKVWAEAAEDRGATFFFTLGD